jgi:hypothetical protein
MMRAKQIYAYDVNAGKNSSYFKGAHDVFTILDAGVLHFSAPQPLQSAPELQQARL